MQWPLALTDDDLLIVRAPASDGQPRFMVCTRAGITAMHVAYADAEAYALEHAARANAHAWYEEGARMYLLADAHIRRPA